MALPREMQNVFSEGFARLLPATLQIPGVVKLYIRALEVSGEDLLEVLPAVDDISQ
jgi:hypothetical protein